MVAAVTVRKDGKAEMAYVGELPWHGLGEKLEQGASIEEWQVSAGMDWRIQRSMVRYVPGAGKDFITLPDQHVLFRNDTGLALGIVSDKFKVVQPAQVLEFFRDLVETAGFQLTTAGTLFEGRRFWAQAEIGAEGIVVGDDVVKGKLLLATAADGTLKTTARNCAERVVCNNTLSIALGEKGRHEVAISHRSRFDPKAVKTQFGLAANGFNMFMVQARQLSKRSLTTEKAEAFVETLLTATKIVTHDDVRASKAYQQIMGLFEGAGKGATLRGVEGTLWGVTNAVTEYVDHLARAATQSNRLSSAWFGRGDALKSEAWDRAVALV